MFGLKRTCQDKINYVTGAVLDVLNITDADPNILPDMSFHALIG